MAPSRRSLVAIGIATLLGGCGLGPGRGTNDVSVVVTRDFGQRLVKSVAHAKVPGSETVMRLLERSFHVQTRYGGGFIESIDGLSGAPPHLDWFYYVNGVEATLGAAGTGIHRGDRVWWDLHDWTATDSIPAVVGSFPEPFLHGTGGRRWPTTLACATDTAPACAKVASELKAIGVPAATQTIGSASGTDSIAVVVGTWKDVRGELAGTLIAHGPAASGIYARFAGPDGGTLELLDPAGRVARSLGAGAGLIAATSQSSAAPTWLIIGTDPAGVGAAAAALTASRLRDHFALAVQDGRDMPVPLKAAS